MAMLDSNSDSQNPGNKGEVSFSLAPKDRAAMAIVLGDFEKSETWLSFKQWALRWRESQLRYEPIREIQYWEGTTVPRSSLNVFSVAQVSQAINAKVIEGIFSDDPPFNTQPRKGTDAEEARAIGALLHFQTEDCDFRREIDDGAADAVLFGTSIWKANWEETRKIRRTYKRKEEPKKEDPGIPGVEPSYVHTQESDDIVVVRRHTATVCPTLELQDLYTTYVDPGCRHADIRRAKWGHQLHYDLG